MAGLDISMNISGYPAEFGFTYADMIRKLGTHVINGHARKVTRNVKKFTPSRKPKERKLANGALNKQTDRYGTLKKQIKVKKIRQSQFSNTFVKFVISRGDAYWYNFLRDDTPGERVTKKGYNRGSMKPVRDWVTPVVFSEERQLLNEINEANKNAINLAYKLNPQARADFSSNDSGTLKKVKKNGTL